MDQMLLSYGNSDPIDGLCILTCLIRLSDIGLATKQPFKGRGGADDLHMEISLRLKLTTWLSFWM